MRFAQIEARQLAVLVAAGGSGLLLAGAFAFEHIGGLLPCTLCLWQRWPHAAALALAGAALRYPNTRIWPVLGALAALTTAAIAFFHVGVEMRWWEGLASCTINALAGISGGDLLSLDTNIGAPAACDAVAWSFLGLSMAAWNGVLSLGLAAIWLRAAMLTRAK
jgi:disulfide bond formation protein DsbB